MSPKAMPVWPRRLGTLAIMLVILGGCLWSVRQLALFWAIGSINYMSNLHGAYQSVEHIADGLAYEVYLSRFPREMLDGSDGAADEYDHVRALYNRQSLALMSSGPMRLEVTTSAPDSFTMTVGLLRDRDCAPVLNVLLYNDTDFTIMEQVAKPAVSNLFQPLDLDYNFMSGPRLDELQALSLNGQAVDLSPENDMAPFEAFAALLAERNQQRRDGGSPEPIEIVARLSALDEVPDPIQQLWRGMIEKKRGSDTVRDQ